MKIVNSTFVNNHALACAGAIKVFYGSAILTNNTFTGNAAALPGGYGGAILNNWGTVTFRNNLLVNNSATNGPNCENGGGAINDDGGNLVWGGGNCPGASANPLIGTLGYVGGVTPTLPLLPDSPAINAASANCPDFDERRKARSASCDSGAFESQGFTLTKTGGDNQRAVFNTPFSNPLSLNVSSSYDEPVNGGVVSFTPPTSGASAVINSSPATITGGSVSVSAIANGSTGGPYNVTASSAGAPSINFSLTNTLRMIFLPWIGH